VFLIFRDEQRGATVPHLIFDFGRGGGRIDAIDDGSERLRREVANHPFLAGVSHDGDAVALRKSEGCKGACRTRDQRRIVAPASFTVEAQMLGAKCGCARCRPCTLAQQQRCGLATQRVAIERWPCDHAAPGERLQIEFLAQVAAKFYRLIDEAVQPQSFLPARSAPWRKALNFSHTTL